MEFYSIQIERFLTNFKTMSTVLLLINICQSIRTIENAERLDRPGWDHGLVVVVHNEPEDYFYPLISSIGVNVKLLFL